MKLGLWGAAQRKTQQQRLFPRTLTQFLVTVAFRADLFLAVSLSRVSPEHLGDGEHEGIVEYDAQGPGQKVRPELARQRPEQEEPGALLLLQLPQELSLVGQSAPEGGA